MIILPVQFIPDKKILSKLSPLYLSLVFCSVLMKFVINFHLAIFMILIMVVEFHGWNFRCMGNTIPSLCTAQHFYKILNQKLRCEGVKDQNSEISLTPTTWK